MYDTEEQKNKILIIRNLTGFPSWDISKALQKCNWDTNQAIALLKKQPKYIKNKPTGNAFIVKI